MAEQQHSIGKTEQAMNPQVRKETAAEAIQRDPYHAQAAVQQAAETGAEQEGLESMSGRIGNAASRAATGAQHAVSGTMHSVASVGDDVIGVTRDVLKGVVSATEDVGSSLVGGVQHIAKDVLHGVEEVGSAAVHTLTGLLVGVVGGVKTVVGEAMPHRGAEAEQAGGVIERKRSEAAESQGRTAGAERTRVEETTVH